MHRVGLVGFGPLQQAEREVERIGAAFFEADARGGVDRQQMAVERVLRDARHQLVVAQRFVRHVVERAAAGAAAGMHLRDARVGAFHECRQWANLEIPAFRQCIFKHRQIRRHELERRLGRLEIQQLVAQREVEQPRFPLGQPAIGRVVVRQVERLQRVGIEGR